LTTPVGEDLITPGPRFRLGTAAGPFPLSAATAIGDFDADDLPDFAIADRLGRAPTGYRYTLEQLLSNGSSQTFEFNVPLDALSVRLQDVDGDHDLDVVATPAIGDEVVGVWLNDGTGHFVDAGAGSVWGRMTPSAAMVAAAALSLLSDPALMTKCGFVLRLLAGECLTPSTGDESCPSLPGRIASSVGAPPISLRGPPGGRLPDG
jgi:hypothetical protein